MESIQLTQPGSMAGSSERGNEPSRSMKGQPLLIADDIRYTISVTTTTATLLASHSTKMLVWPLSFI